MFPCFPEEVKELVEKKDWDALEELYTSYNEHPTQEELLARFTEEEKENYLWYMKIEKIINDENDLSSVLPPPHLARKHLLLGLLNVKAKDDPRIESLIQNIEDKVAQTPRMWTLIEEARYLRDQISNHLKFSECYADVDVYRRFKAMGIFVEFSYDWVKCGEQMDIFDDIGYSEDMIKKAFYLVRDECSDLVQYFITEGEWDHDGPKPEMDALKLRFRFMRQYLLTDELKEMYAPFAEFDWMLFPLEHPH